MAKDSPKRSPPPNGEVRVGEDPSFPPILDLDSREPLMRALSRVIADKLVKKAPPSEK